MFYYEPGSKKQLVFPIHATLEHERNQTMKRFGIAIASLLFVSAVSLAFLVIPSVRVDKFPGATPDRAVPVIWVVATLLAAFAVGQLYFFSSPRRLRDRWVRVLLVLMACLLFLIALAQTDGAAAYGEEGPEMHVTSVAMFATAGICVIDGLFSIVVTYLRRKTQPGQAA